jgi:LAO/AO transport system kinase
VIQPAINIFFWIGTERILFFWDYLLDEALKKVLAGEKQAIARLITAVENEAEGYQDKLDRLFKYTGRAYHIGITGAPGTGKSTLTNQLTRLIRNENVKVGIIAVDPTSPFTGGAVLGDRLRMNQVILDKGVFIRSMATRGSLGGLAAKATEVADILDAAGYDYIIYETVGVGQVELDIAEAADSTIVLVVPEGGDIVQGMKSGLMEIGDLFVVNKSDRPGADRMKTDLEYVLHLKEAQDGWSPKVLATIASKNQGIEVVWDQIKIHREFLLKNEQLQKKRRTRIKKRLELLIRDEIEHAFWDARRRKILQKYLEDEKNSYSPYKLARNLLSELLDNL